ncbi:MAG: hypothetical protein WAK20_09225 [Candidatus Acidiferrum sp.]
MASLNMSGRIVKSLLIITGAMGAGKTSVLGEASDILTLRHVAHAAIDVDALGLAYLPTASGNDAVMHGNLRSVCVNYASIGVTRFLLARALESRAQLDLYRGIVLATSTVVCRLTANIETMERRVKERELGVSQREYVARVAKLNFILDRARLEDFSISSENRSITEVAHEMLVRAGWISM